MLASFANSTEQASRGKYTTAILKMLNSLGVGDAATARIMKAVQGMADSKHVQGALNFLTEVTAKKSKREDYYQYSNHIAEYFCTISNLGMFAVAYYYSDYATLFAATFSALSHAIPSQRLHDLDLLGVFLIFGKVAANYKILLAQPSVLAWGVGAMGLNLLDTFITRSYPDEAGSSIHEAWHLVAALALYKFNQAQAEITPAELDAIFLSNSLTFIPTYLKDSFGSIGKYLASFSGSRARFQA